MVEVRPTPYAVRKRDQSHSSSQCEPQLLYKTLQKSPILSWSHPPAFSVPFRLCAHCNMPLRPGPGPAVFPCSSQWGWGHRAARLPLGHPCHGSSRRGAHCHIQLHVAERRSARLLGEERDGLVVRGRAALPRGSTFLCM